MLIAYAADAAHIEKAKSAVEKLEAAIIFPLMSLMMAVAFLVFLWGVYEFVLNADSDEARNKGKTHMLFGVIGFLVMVSALAILKIAAGTFGVDVPN